MKNILKIVMLGFIFVLLVGCEVKQESINPMEESANLLEESTEILKDDTIIEAPVELNKIKKVYHVDYLLQTNSVIYLPSKIKVEYEDSTKGLEEVLWENPGTISSAVATKITVKGTLKNYDVEVLAQIEFTNIEIIGKYENGYVYKGKFVDIYYTSNEEPIIEDLSMYLESEIEMIKDLLDAPDNGENYSLYIFPSLEIGAKFLVDYYERDEKTVINYVNTAINDRESTGVSPLQPNQPDDVVVQPSKIYPVQSHEILHQIHMDIRNSLLLEVDTVIVEGLATYMTRTTPTFDWEIEFLINHKDEISWEVLNNRSTVHLGDDYLMNAPYKIGQVLVKYLVDMYGYDKLAAFIKLNDYESVYGIDKELLLDHFIKYVINEEEEIVHYFMYEEEPLVTYGYLIDLENDDLKSIKTVESDLSIDVHLGVALELPQTLQVTLKDNSQIECTMNWNEYNSYLTTVGKHIVEGKCEQTNDIITYTLNVIEYSVSNVFEQELIYENDYYKIHYTDSDKYEVLNLAELLNEEVGNVITLLKLDAIDRVDIWLYPSKESYQQFHIDRGETVASWQIGGAMNFTEIRMASTLDQKSENRTVEEARRIILHEFIHILDFQINSQLIDQRHYVFETVQEGIPSYLAHQFELFDLTYFYKDEDYFTLSYVSSVDYLRFVFGKLLIEYVVEEYGSDVLKDIIVNRDITVALGITLEELETGYNNYLRMKAGY